MKTQPNTALVPAGSHEIAYRITVGEFVNEWREYLTLQVDAGTMSPDSANAYSRGMLKFTGWLADRTPDGDAILAWMADLRNHGNKPGAINAWLGGVRSFFSWAMSRGHIPYNPAAGLRGAKRTGTKKRHIREALTDAEVLRVLAQPDRSTTEGARDYALLAMQLYTAARGIELHRADLADLATSNGRFVLNVQGKGREEKDEPLVLVGEAETAMREWLSARGHKPGALFVSLSDRSRGERLSRRAMREIVKQYFTRAGIVGNKTTHSLRHTAITNAIRHGVPITRVSKHLARHASIDTTMVYVHEVDRLSDPVEEHISYGNGTGE